MTDNQPLGPTDAELWQLHMQMPGQHKDPIDFASAALASHGQAPAGATEPTEQQILEAAFAPAQPAAEPSRFGSPELQAMIVARCVEKDQADSVLEDAARLDFLIDQRAYVVSDPDACPGYWLHWARPDGSTWVQGDEHPTPRAAIDAARKQGANHD